MDYIEKINSSLKNRDKSQLLDNLSNVYRYLLKEKKVGGLIQNKQRARTNSNSNNKNKNKIPVKKLLRSLTFDNMESINIDFDVIKDLEDISVSSESTSHNSLNTILINPILNKNISIVDDVMKLMVIGDQKVGKSYFIKKLLAEDLGTTDNEKKYSHTNSFEIKKKNVKLLGKNICLEIWDTNTDVLKHDMCKGKFIKK
jgi:hypothetical protein